MTLGEIARLQMPAGPTAGTDGRQISSGASVRSWLDWPLSRRTIACSALRDQRQLEGSAAAAVDRHRRRPVDVAVALHAGADGLQAERLPVLPEREPGLRQADLSDRRDRLAAEGEGRRRRDDPARRVLGEHAQGKGIDPLLR